MTRDDAARLRGLIADVHPTTTVAVIPLKTGAVIMIDTPLDSYAGARHYEFFIRDGPSAVLRGLVGIADPLAWLAGLPV